MTDVYIGIPSPKVKEGSSFTAAAYFRLDGTASASSTAKYRIDCLTTNKVLQDWTDLTPATIINIAVTATHNAIQSQDNRLEKKQITVASDPDTSTQTRDAVTWQVKNIRGF